MKGVISIFLLPFELEDFAITLHSLKRNSAFCDKETSIKIDISLCLSDEMTDWKTTKLPKGYIEERTTELCKVYLDWCIYELYIERSNTILGCSSHRRKSWKENQNADFFIWLDPDMFFKDITLSCVINSFKMLKDAGQVEFVITPQIVRQWDTSWDILVNKNYVTKHLNYQAESDIFTDSLAVSEIINIAEIPTFKFAGGWFTLFSKELIDKIGIPDSLGHYGLEDTFIMQCCILMKGSGCSVRQFLLENLIVGENYKHETHRTIKKYISFKSRKHDFRKIAELSFENELKEFTKLFLEKNHQ